MAALDKLFRSPDIGCVPINLGTGTGTTVLEMVKVGATACHQKDSDLEVLQKQSMYSCKC